MYKYPEYNPQSVGGFMNPRDYGNTMGTPVVPTYPSITSGMYDTSSSSFPTRTVGQARVLDGMGQTNIPTMQTYGLSTPSLSGAIQSSVGGYTPNFVATPTYTPDMARATPTIGASLKSMFGLGGDKFNQIKDGVISGVETAGANANTAWGKMSYGERGSALLGGATSLYNAYNARKSGKLAKEQFNFTKESFNRNFEATAKTTNAALADRQASRVARDPKAYASVADYMKKYGV